MSWPQDVLAVLAAKPARGRANTWVARCPGHPDRTPSLRIWLGRDGRLLLRCWTRSPGCHWKILLARAGLKMGDLFPPAQRGAYGDWEPRRHVNRTAVAWYDYTDEWGVVLYQKVRYEPKDFRLRRPDGAGGWRWNAEGVRRVLFRLPALLADPRQPVIVVEGEKDVLAAEGLGLLATTSAEGAGAGWDDDTYPAQLRGRRVVVIPDHDAPGLAHAERIVGALLRPRPEWGGPGVAGVAGVRLVELPGLGPHGDLADWVQAGGTREELIGIIRAAPEWLPKGQLPG